jgi:hypothetical protein
VSAIKAYILLPSVTTAVKTAASDVALKTIGSSVVGTTRARELAVLKQPKRSLTGVY